jgi:hypothetical protein
MAKTKKQEEVQPVRVVENRPYGSPAYLNFDDFWAKKSKELGLPQSMKRVIRAHLVSAGFDRPDLYEAGLKHFGM